MANNLQNALMMTSAGVVIPDTSVIREAIVNDLEETVFQQKIDTSEETVLGRLIEWMTLCFSQICGITAWTANQFNIKQATGTFLDAWADNFNISRKTSSNSRVFCTVSGTQGTDIPSGSYVSNSKGDLFTCDSTITIDSSGTASGYFTAVDPGPIPCSANTITTIRSAISGWDSVTNTTDGYVGTDTESDYSLRNRILENTFVGTGYVGTVTNALMELDGVSDALVLSNPKSSADTINGITMPAHSIYVCVLGGDEDEIANVIYKTKPIGAAYTSSGTNNVNKIVTDEYSGQSITVSFNKPSPKTATVTLTARNQSYAGDDIETDINNAITEFFASKGIGKTMTAIELAMSIQEQVGGIVVTELHFNSNDSSISCTSQQIIQKSGNATITIQ